ncbi:MAG: hypothetical protein R3B45_03540 [Bdellovibrionota bacterium]
MFIDFEKWHGCKNDFVIVRLSKADGNVMLDSLKRVSPSLCNRDGTGIGADGVLVLHGELRDSLLPERLTIINSDGSIANNCGNGLRCAALSVLKHFKAECKPHDQVPEMVELEVEGVKKLCRFMDGKDGDKIPLVAVEMGIPAVNSEISWCDTVVKEARTILSSLNIAQVGTNANFELDCCEIGNPHLVFFLPEVNREMLLMIGPAMQNLSILDGVNIHLVESTEPTNDDQSLASQLLAGRVSEVHKTFVWERGAGETQACGSGACAIAACSLKNGFSSRQEWMAIDMPGGRLYAKQDDPKQEVVLAGPANFVYSGIIEI